MGSSIWDPPGGYLPVVEQREKIAMVDGPLADRQFGRAAGRPLWVGRLFGVYNGAPLGQNEKNRQASLQKRYGLQPDVLRRLRDATRAAIGR